MKRLLLLLILTFSFQSWAKTDDIRDFEIEGMSIGDSLLNYYSEDFIIKSFKKSRYVDKSFIRIEFNEGIEFYDSVQIHVKKNDSKYIIEMLGGIKFYKDDIQTCYKKQKLVLNDLKSIFKDTIFGEISLDKHPVDKTGKSTVSSIDGNLLSQGLISIQCYDWSETEKFTDLLKVTMKSSDFVYWIRNKAF